MRSWVNEDTSNQHKGKFKNPRYYRDRFYFNSIYIAETNNKYYKSNSKLANLELTNNKVYISQKKKINEWWDLFCKKELS